MFNKKPKLKLTFLQESKLEMLVLRTGLHPDTILNKIVVNGLDQWMSDTDPDKPPAPPAPPATKLINGNELPYDSNISTPPGKRGYW